jgi:CheY-like chemotaxis protein
VLIVDDDLTVVHTYERFLRSAGFEVATAATTQSGLAAARRGFDVMLLDVRLGSDDGLDVLRAVRAEGLPGHVIVITGFDTEGIEAKARDLGAEFVDRWTLPDPVELVTHALAKGGLAQIEPDGRPVVIPPALTHWAETVAKGIECPEDLKSVAHWARCIGKSDTSLRELCALAGISAERSRTLVRVLRAVHLARRSGRMEPWEWLDVADHRTLDRLLAAAGVPAAGPASIDDVLRRQRLVTKQVAIAVLSRVLRHAGFLDD